MYRSSRESSSSDEDELVIWPYGESVWDEHPESAMRAASYFRASTMRARREGQVEVHGESARRSHDG